MFGDIAVGSLTSAHLGRTVMAFNGEYLGELIGVTHFQSSERGRETTLMFDGRANRTTPSETMIAFGSLYD